MNRYVYIIIALVLAFSGAALSQISGGGAPTGAAGGDLTGTYPSPTVKASVALTTPNIGAATGTSLILSAAVTATTATFTTIASDAGHTDATLCADSSTGLLYKGSGTLGICLGTSSARYKQDIHPVRSGLDEVLRWEPVTYRYRPESGHDATKDLYGFTAEQINAVTPKLVGLDTEGRANSVDMLGMIPLMAKAIQEQQAEIAELKARLK